VRFSRLDPIAILEKLLEEGYGNMRLVDHLLLQLVRDVVEERHDLKVPDRFDGGRAESDYREQRRSDVHCQAVRGRGLVSKRAMSTMIGESMLRGWEPFGAVMVRREK
jgi:hypothetical protein